MLRRPHLSSSLLVNRLAPLLPGVAFALVVALAAAFISGTHGGPVVLFALLIGMAFNFLGAEAWFAPGLGFASRAVLRVGVALLGARITLDEVAGLGWGTLASVALIVAATILFGLVLARAMGLGAAFGTLTAGAVAICGASAAVAIASVLPPRAGAERDTAFTIVGVTTLSTVAMVLYPVLTGVLGFDDRTAGVFLGATIHDVAQVVGAGFSVSAEAGTAATVVKMLRVALLVPVVFVVALVSRRVTSEATMGTKRPPLLPAFLIVFLALVAANSAGAVPRAVQALLADASRWCIVVSIAALGVKTSLASLVEVGRPAILLMVAETAFIGLAGVALVAA